MRDDKKRDGSLSLSLYLSISLTLDVLFLSTSPTLPTFQQTTHNFFHRVIATIVSRCKAQFMASILELGDRTAFFSLHRGQTSLFTTTLFPFLKSASNTRITVTRERERRATPIRKSSQWTQ